MDEQALVDRFLGIQFLEACRCLSEGVAAAEDIDLGMQAGAGLPIGPLHRADEAGLDVTLATLERLEAAAGPRFAPPALLRAHVAAGRLGRKAGRGFFDYPEG